MNNKAAFEKQARQPEIDELLSKLRNLEVLYQKKVDDCAEMEIRMHRQIEALKDQVEVGKRISQFQEAELQQLRTLKYSKIGPY